MENKKIKVLNTMLGLVAPQNMFRYKDENFSQCQTDLLEGLIACKNVTWVIERKTVTKKIIDK